MTHPLWERVNVGSSPTVPINQTSRLRVRFTPPRLSLPSSIGKDSGLSRRKDQFNSGREHHWGRSSMEELSAVNRMTGVRFSTSPL